MTLEEAQAVMKLTDADMGRLSIDGMRIILKDDMDALKFERCYPKGFLTSKENTEREIEALKILICYAEGRQDA